MPDLVPVDYDPFAPQYQLLPVDHQPDFGDAPMAKAGQTVARPDVLGEQARVQSTVRGGLSDLLGISDAARALRGEMTPEEAQNFALIGAAGMVAPEARGLGAAAEEAAPAVARGVRASPYLKEVLDWGETGTKTAEPGIHFFTIHDESGLQIGNLNVSNQDPRNLKILDVHGPGATPGNLGTGGVRSLLEQLLAKFPEADTVGGTRMGGAHRGTEVIYNIPTVGGMANFKTTPVDHDPFAEQ